MIIETERLILKPYEKENLNDYHTLLSNPMVWTYSTNIPQDNILESEKRLNEIIEKYDNDFTQMHALYRKDDMVYIGEAGVLAFNSNANRCVTGYNLLPDYWKNGYATEISKSLIKYAFDELKVERIEALAAKNNIASCRVLEKSGMILEGVLRNFSRIRGEYLDVSYYSIIRSDYQ